MKKDLMEKIKKEHGSKVANRIVVIVAVTLLALWIYRTYPHWDKIDFSVGRGGNPQEGYLDERYD